MTKEQRKSRTPAKPRRSRAKVVKRPSFVRRLLRLCLRGALGFVVLVGLVVGLCRFVNPPTTYYIWSEGRRLQASVAQIWVPAEEIAPVMLRAAVAAEDANFCQHWGFDIQALRDAIADGGTRGASTISQQVVKNVFLWHGRTYSRKALEALLTPVVEAVWPKRRILEVYLNVAEFDEGVFGVEAAARHYFGVSAKALSPTQAGRLAAILPAPKARSAARPSSFVQRRGGQIVDGAATIQADGRAACFE